MSKYLVISETQAVIEADCTEEVEKMYYDGDEIISVECVKSIQLLSETDSPLRELICE